MQTRHSSSYEENIKYLISTQILNEMKKLEIKNYITSVDDNGVCMQSTLSYMGIMVHKSNTYIPFRGNKNG